MNREFHLTCLSAAGLLVAGACMAQGHPLGPEQRTWFEAQAFVPRTSTTFRADPLFEAGTGTSVGGEQDLGQSRNRPAMGLGFGRRIGERWRFEVDYLRLERKGDTALPRDLRIGDFTYTAGSQVHSESVFQFARIVGGWSFVQSEAVEMGLVIGGALPRYRLNLDGPAVARQEEITAGVLPMLGLFVSAQVAPGFQMSGRLEGGQASGSAMVNASANAVWRITPNVALGAGLRYVSGHVKDESLGIGALFANSRLDFRLGGPQFFANFAF